MRGRRRVAVPRERSSPRPRASEPSPGSDPFQVLLGEHAVLRLQVGRALEAGGRGAGRAGTRAALGALADGFRAHQRREDSLVFPVCERILGGKDGVVAVLRRDHAAIRAALDDLLRQSLRRRAVPADLIEDLHTLLESHLVREERVLFLFLTAELDGRQATTLARRLRCAPAA